MFGNDFWKMTTALGLALALTLTGCSSPSGPGNENGNQEQPAVLTASIVPYAETDHDGTLIGVGEHLVFRLVTNAAVQTVVWATDDPDVLGIEAYPMDGAGPAAQISAARIRARGVSDGDATLTATATAADGRTATASLEIDVADMIRIVTLNFGDERENTTIRVRYGATATAPEQPTRAFDYSVAGLFPAPIPGFGFGGWHLGDAPFDFDTPITANITLNARWNNPPSVDLTGQPGETLAHRAFGFVSNSQPGTNYALLLDADVPVAGGDPADGSGGLGIWQGGNLSLHTTGGQVEIGLSSTGFLIQIGEGSTLTLYSGIALRGMAGNDIAAVRVLNGATLIMHDGSAISGNTNTSQGVASWGFNGNFGGGVFVAGGSYFYMEGGEIYGNTVNAQGGGVQVNDATFTMRGGYIRDNNATEGGGVFVSNPNGAFIMEGGEITGNTVSNNDDVSYPGEFDFLPGIGGGVNIGYRGTFTMEGGHIHDNNAAVNAGGVNIGYRGTLTMKGGHIHDNTAVSGGGVSIGWGGAFTMEDGQIHDNTATSTASNGGGGGVFIGGNSNFQMKGGAIRGNIARYGAGVSFPHSNGNFPFVMSGGAIHGNTAESGGGVNIGWGGDFTMSAGAIRDNIANHAGGGVSISNNAEFAMYGGAIHGNTARWGSGVYTGGTFTLSSTGEIHGNTASENGGGVNMTGGYFTMSGGVIRGNIATGTSGTGGGVNIGNGTFEMTNGAIHGNTSHYGGGVNAGSGTLEMSNGQIHNNTANQGAGVNIWNGTLEMTGGAIRDNNSTLGDHGSGGGVSLSLGGTFTLSGGEVRGNTAASQGAGVRIFGGTLEMEGGAIRDNSTLDHAAGGGVFIGGNLENAGIFSLRNGDVHDNVAGSGAGVYVGQHGRLAMWDGVIRDNTIHGYGDGGGVLVSIGGEFLMDNGQISGNTALRGGGVFVHENAYFLISSGVIHGSAATYGYDANIATVEGGAGAALFVVPYGTAQRGTFGNFPSEFASLDNLSITSDTINVLDGNLQ